MALPMPSCSTLIPSKCGLRLARGHVETVQKNSVFLLDSASSSGYTRFNSLVIIDGLRLSMGWQNNWWYAEESIGFSAAPAERLVYRFHIGLECPCRQPSRTRERQ